MTFTTLDAARAEEVWAVLAQHVGPTARREVPLEQALGAVLARDVVIPHDYPPFDRAVMDGYAVRCADFVDGQARLRVVGLAGAGLPAAPAVTPGTSVQINTGAPLPEGADAVVIFEKSRADGNGSVELTDRPQPGQAIERRGALLRAGDRLLSGGTRVGPGALASLAAAGQARVEVFARPTVALLATGDELVSRGRGLNPGQIHDSNSAALEVLIRRAGAEVSLQGRCPDDRAALRASLELGLGYPMLCVSGGMSKGTHDLVPQLLDELGVQWLVRSLNLKPGKPARIGRAPSGAWVIGLPGNPVSAAVCFELFGSLILARLSGLDVRRPPRLRAALQSPLPGNGARPMYHPASWGAGAEGQGVVNPIPWRGSGDPFAMAGANALIERCAEAPPAAPGEIVWFIPLDRPV
jgi:molybdopterin molybdotransferase